MNITAKTTAIIITSSVALLIVISILINTILTEKFRELEQTGMEESLVMVASTISKESQSLGEKAADWGRWDDSYLFVKGENPSFTEVNINEGTLQGLGIDSMVYCNADGSMLFGMATEQFKAVIGEENVEEWLSLLAQAVPERKGQGLLLLGDIDLMVGSSQVIPTSYVADPIGKIIMAKKVDDAELSMFTGQKAFIDHVQYLPEEYQHTLQGSDQLVKQVGPDLIEGIMVIDDVNEEGTFALRLESNRPLDKERKNTIVYLLGGMALVMALNAVILMVTIKRNVISRVVVMSKQLTLITENGDQSGKLLEEGEDEIADLARETNRYIALSRTSQQIIEQKSKDLNDMLEELEQINKLTVDSEINAHRVEEDFQAYARKVRHEIAALRKDIEAIEQRREKEEGR